MLRLMLGLPDARDTGTEHAADCILDDDRSSCDVMVAGQRGPIKPNPRKTPWRLAPLEEDACKYK
jgi:hypothetical protein